MKTAGSEDAVCVVVGARCPLPFLLASLVGWGGGPAPLAPPPFERVERGGNKFTRFARRGSARRISEASSLGSLAGDYSPPLFFYSVFGKYAQKKRFILGILLSFFL